MKINSLKICLIHISQIKINNFYWSKKCHSMEQWVKQAAASSHKIGHTPLNVCGEPKNYPEYGNFKKT
jgi:hypothetical protein